MSNEIIVISNIGTHSYVSGVCQPKKLLNSTISISSLKLLQIASITHDKICSTMDPKTEECWFECVLHTPDHETAKRHHAIFDEKLEICLGVWWGSEGCYPPDGAEIVSHIFLDHNSWEIVRSELREQISEMG